MERFDLLSLRHLRGCGMLWLLTILLFHTFTTISFLIAAEATCPLVSEHREASASDRLMMVMNDRSLSCSDLQVAETGLQAKSSQHSVRTYYS
jgi:hypothetical protein